MMYMDPKTGSIQELRDWKADANVPSVLVAVCEFCLTREVDEPGSICLSCCETMADRIDSVDHQNGGDW